MRYYYEEVINDMDRQNCLLFSDEEEDNGQNDGSVTSSADEATPHLGNDSPQHLATEDGDTTSAVDAGMAVHTAVEDELGSNPGRYIAYHCYSIPEDDEDLPFVLEDDPAAEQAVLDREKELSALQDGISTLGPERPEINSLTYHRNLQEAETNL